MEEDKSESGVEQVADKPVQRVSLKERLAEMQVRVMGRNTEKGVQQKIKGNEVSIS